MDAATNNKNPKTVTLVRLPSGQTTNRFAAAVRGFLQDLPQVQRISSDLADQQHYCHLNGISTRPLSRLEAVGPITDRSHLPIQLWLLLRTGARALPGFRTAGPGPKWTLALRVAAKVNAAARALRSRSGPEFGVGLIRAPEHRTQTPGGVRITRYRPRRPGSMESGDRPVP